MSDQMTQILLVEDEKAHAELVRRAFDAHRQRFTLTVADSLAEARACLAEAGPDLIITDLRLPDGLGTDLLTAEGEEHAIPLMVMTAHGDEHAAVESLKAGALDCLVKSEAILADTPRIAERALREWRHITERKRAEEALRESEERFRRVFEESPVGICLLDEERRYLEANNTFCQMLGYTEEELIGGTLADVTHPEDVEDCEELLNKTLSGGITGFQLEKRYITKNQGVIWASVTGGSVPDKTGKPQYVMGIVENITDSKRLAEQLVQAQKMEVVGQLAGGVAHDFNNLLTPILGFTQLGIDELSRDHPACAYLEQVQAAAERGADLVRQLLSFSRRQTVEPRLVDLNGLVLNTDQMLRRLIGEHIELVCLPAPDIGMVRVDPGQMEEVLVNMAINARDAMPSGGKLSIETAQATLETDSAQEFQELVPGPYVKLSIRDTGIGMEEEVKSHLFEPFFTTKETGKGTGLGLATCYGIVKQAGGEIQVQSEPGQGTAFEIYLPRVEDAAISVAEGSHQVKPPIGMETVLLVEDEPTVRRLAAEVLRRQGYAVLEAEDGEEALTVGQEHGGKEIHLLLTDVVMPHMGGRELADCLRPLMPRLKVLFTSGFPDQAGVSQGAAGTGVFFLPKPYTPAMLGQKVREVLDSPAPDA